MFSMHVYGESSSIPPDFPHPRTTSIGLADHDKLVDLLVGAFGSAPPIVYGEYGIETEIPAAHRAAYAGAEVPSVHPVDEETQGEWYADAIRLAACQADVRMLFLFHVSDERELDRLQTGVYYADDQPKASLPVVRDAIEREVRCGP
jgi:hypothetical protein